MKKNVFSGIQPTGGLTIGHIGLFNLWSSLQKKYNCYYCIVDLHSLTNLKINSFLLKKNILDIVAMLLAFNINPLKSVIFLQSSILEHTYLYWILNCFSSVGDLKRMTQFKEKKNKLFSNSGLFTYPILMASDILLYKTSYVPVGIDQIQHIEFTRKIAKKFNKYYNCNLFKIPKYILCNNFSKIMSLINVEKKMSKSDININNYISLLDSDDLIRLKIKNSVTDSDNPSKIYYDMYNKPGISNLLNILSLIKNESIELLQKKFLNFNYLDFKNIVADELIKFISLLKEKFFYFRNENKYLKDLLISGSLKSNRKVSLTIQEINELLGISKI